MYSESLKGNINRNGWESWSVKVDSSVDCFPNLNLTFDLFDEQVFDFL